MNALISSLKWQYNYTVRTVNNYYSTLPLLPWLQVWRYDEGDVTHVGRGHSGSITALKISPDSRYIVSVSEDGGILTWRYPHTASTLDQSMGELNIY